MNYGPVSPERLIQGYLSTIERLERTLKRSREDLRFRKALDATPDQSPIRTAAPPEGGKP
jgi:hypothetical protein